MKKKCICVFFSCLALLCSCKKKAEVRDGTSIVIGIAAELNNFDPFTSITAETRSVNFNIFDGLVNVDTDGSFIPAIAQSYTMAADAMSYTFILRKDVYFHNDQVLTADDVLYSIQKAIDSSIAGYEKIAAVRKTEDGNIEIQLSLADAGFIAYLTTPIVPQDAQNLALQPIGTGPYKFAGYEEKDRILLLRNERYWGTPGTLKKITLLCMHSQKDFLPAFRRGRIDGFSANADIALQLQKNTINLYQRNSHAVQLLALNNEFAPFANPDVRRAINYLVNVDEIIQYASYGYGIKVGSALIPALSKYYERTLVGMYTRNVSKAKELLEKANYAHGFAFTIVVPTTYTVHVQTAKIIAKQLASAGIKVSVKKVEWDDWLQSVYKNRHYEASIISLDGKMAYPTAYLARYVSDSGNNFVNFSSSAYDAAYSAAISATSEAERIAYFKRAQRILSEECASVFIQDISMLTVYNKHFKGNKEYPLYVMDFTAIQYVAE